MNLTAIDSPNGGLELHDASCATVQQARDRGYPLITLFGCERVPEDSAFVLAPCVSSPGRPLPGGSAESAI